MDYLQKQLKLQETIRGLPAAVQRALGDIDPITTISGAADRYECTLGEIGDIFEEVRRVIAGQARAQELAENIRPKLDPERQEHARTIAEEINRTVLGPVMGVMQESISDSKEKFQPLPPLNKASQLQKLDSFTASKAFGAAKASEASEARREAPEPLRGIRTMPRDEELVQLLTNIGRGTPHPFEKIKAAYDNVPEEVKRAVTSVDRLAKKIQTIAEKYDLHVDKAGELGSETGLLMIGLTHPTEFVGNIAKRLGVPREKALEIGREVNAEIFRPIREELKEMYGIEGKASTAGQLPKLDSFGKEKAVPASEASQPDSLTASGEKLQQLDSLSASKAFQDLGATKTAEADEALEAPEALNAPRGLLEKKLSSIVTVPMEKIDINLQPTTNDPASPDLLDGSQAGRQQPPAAPPPPKGYERDPYREPLQ